MTKKPSSSHQHSHPTSTTLLRWLLTPGNPPLNGNAAARTLGVSRVAIWKHLRKLREAGVPIQSLPKKGYRLPPDPAPLHPDMVAAIVPEELALASVSLHQTTGSTNEDAHRALSAGEPAPLAMIAREQTSGRGRLGKTWESPPGGNLYLSVAFRPMVSPAALEDFSLRTGLRLCQCLRRLTAVPIQLKWPNDLWVGSRKLAGLLMEARVEADLVTTLVLGFGLNVATAPASLPATATSLAAEGYSHPDLNPLTAGLISSILSTYTGRHSPNRRAELSELWSEYSLLQGQPIEATAPSGFRLAGHCEGIDHRGSLILRAADGSRHLIRSGEISVRPADSPVRQNGGPG